MVAASHSPVMVWIALSVRVLIGSNMRWKTSHRIAMPSTDDDCGTLCMRGHPVHSNGTHRLHEAAYVHQIWMGLQEGGSRSCVCA